MNEQGHEMMRLLRNLPPGEHPDFPAKINDLVRRVKEKLKDVLDLVSARDLAASEAVCEYLEDLKNDMEKAMSSRRSLEGGAMVGTAMRIGGTLAYAHPIGQTFFWAGVAVSGLCDGYAHAKGTDVERFSRQIDRILRESEDSFRPVAGAIRRLDEAVLQGTGMSLFDDEFQELLRTAAEAPRDNVVPITVANGQHKNNLIELARNREIVALLREIVAAVSREDIVLLRVASHALFATSFATSSPNVSAGLQVVELAARGITMYLQYKKDKGSLQHVANEIERMHKRLDALREF